MADETATASGAHDERRRTEPQSLRLRAITPGFTVDDIARSVRFYVDGLGFHVDEEWKEDEKLLGVLLVAGACRIGLSQDDWAKGRDRKKGEGFSVWAETGQDLDDLAARLREQGIEHDGPKEEAWGSRTLTVHDPDGFKITFTPS